MFDLFRSREKTVRIMLGGLLLVVAISMLTYLVPNYNTGGPTGSEMVIAEIGSDTITLPEVQKIVQMTMRSRQLPPEILPNYLPTMIDQMITERALYLQAQKLGYQVTDAEVAETIRQMVPNLYPDGKFIGTAQYAAMLAQQNMTIEQFEGDLRRQILIARLRDIAMEGTIVTPAEIEAAFRKKAERVKVEYVKLTADKYKAESQPTVSEMQDFFKTNSSRYMAPEKKNLAILIADQAKLEATINPTDAELQMVYNQNQQAFTTPERVKVRHILIMTQGKPAAEEAKLKAKAEGLLQQVRGGADFAKLAKENSEDPGSKDNGGEYWIQRNGQMVKEFEDAAFTLKPGQSDLVKTAYGYHVFQVVERQAAGLRPFSEVKAEIASQWKKQKVNDILQRAGDQAAAALKQDAAHPDKVAAAFDMQLVTVNGYSGNEIPELGASPEFSQAVVGLKKGEVSQPVAANNKVAVALVTDVTLAHPSSFEEVQSQIKDTMVQNRSVAALQRHAQELVEKATSMGGDLAKAAKSMGLEVKTTPEFERGGTIEGVGSASYLSGAFDKPAGAIFGPTGTPDGASLVGKVLTHIMPDPSLLPTQRSVIRDEIKSQRAKDRATLFEAGIKDALVKSGKIKIHQDVIDRLIASYRTSS
jgi:peptidyl-prolyl cis-trans isomerase D